jgi:hypothetical protein
MVPATINFLIGIVENLVMVLVAIQGSINKNHHY